MAYGMYQVSVKLQLTDGDKLLVLTRPDGYVDFPGGRIDDTEQGLAMEDALVREIREELGEKLRYHVIDTAFVAYRSYEEHGQTHHVLVLHFRTELVSGEIELSEEHADYAWIDPAELYDAADRFASQDEYEHFCAYYRALA